MTALKKRHEALVTNGPFVRVSVGGHGMGQLAPAPRGRAKLDVEVDAAPWVDVRRLELFVNGSRRGKPIDMPPSDEAAALQGHRSICASSATPMSWWSCAATRSAPVLPATPTQSAPTPLAITNPIYLDRDGDGRWTRAQRARQSAQREVGGRSMRTIAWLVCHRRRNRGRQPRRDSMSACLSPPSRAPAAAIAAGYLARDRRRAHELDRAEVAPVGDGVVVRYRQLHAGVPVIGGGVVVRIDGRGQVRRVASSLFDVAAVDVRRTVNAEAALAAARAHARALATAGGRCWPSRPTPSAARAWSGRCASPPVPQLLENAIYFVDARERRAAAAARPPQVRRHGARVPEEPGRGQQHDHRRCRFPIRSRPPTPPTAR